MPRLMRRKPTPEKPRKRAKRVIETSGTRNLFLVSDLHIGCKAGLCPPDGVRLDGGALYMPNAIQRVTWGYWREFWGEWAPTAAHGEPYDVAVIGDALDGRKHAGSRYTENLADQRRIAAEILRPIADGCQRLFGVRGTDAHVGPAAEDEESLFRDLGAVPNAAGQYCRPELWIRVGKALVHCLHHIGTTGSTHYATSAPHRELVEEFGTAARWDLEPPNFVVRAHRHQHVETKITGQHGGGYACYVSIVLPGWQGKTPFSYKIAGGRLALPEFGGVLIRQGDEEFYARERVWHLGRPEVA